MKGTRKTDSLGRPRLALLWAGLRLLTARERLGAIGIVVMMMVAGLLESSVVALVLPLTYVLVDSGAFAQSQIGQFVLATTGARSITGLFPVIAIALVLLLILSALLSTLSTYLVEIHSSRSRTRLSRELLSLCLRAPYGWISTQSTASLVRHLSEDVRYWRKEFIQSILMMIQAGIMILAPSIVVVALAPLNGLIAIASVGVFSYVSIALFRRVTRDNSVEAKRLYDSVNQFLLQSISGLREIKVSGQSAHFVSRFSERNHALNENGVRARMYGGAPASIISLFGQVGMVGTALVLWASGIPTTEIVGQLALIGVVVSRVVPAANRLAAQVSMLFRSAPFVDSLLRFKANLEDQSSGYLGVAEVPDRWRVLELKNVSFAYPGSNRESLKGATLLLERGKLYGFVGRSGAGKTTLVNILLGLLQPTAGSVTIDGVGLSTYSVSDWHKRFGYVPQDAFILDGTLEENVAFGEPVDTARFHSAIKGAQLFEVVEASASDMALGEKGRRLSGGQSQRVAVARALYKAPEVLLLDEATSALDSVTEARLFETISGLPSSPLGLIIAHRVSTLRGCERIFIMEEGAIVESGTYEELLSNSHTFRALAAVVNAAEDPDNAPGDSPE